METAVKPRPRRAYSGQVRKLRNRLFFVQKGLCGHCDKPLTDPADRTFDHVWPHSLGGRYAFCNGLTVHEACNTAKRDKLPTVEMYLRFPHLEVPEEMWV